MIDEKKELKRVVVNLSLSKELQIEYLDKIFMGMSYNLDELLLEFEDSRYLWGIYGVRVHGLFTHDLCFVLDKIDDLGLHELDDLTHALWDQVRAISADIINEITLTEKGEMGF